MSSGPWEGRVRPVQYCQVGSREASRSLEWPGRRRAESGGLWGSRLVEVHIELAVRSFLTAQEINLLCRARRERTSVETDRSTKASLVSFSYQMNAVVNSRAITTSHTILEDQTLTDDISHLPLDRRIWWRFKSHKDVVSDKLGCHGAKKFRIGTTRHRSSVQQKPWQRIGGAKTARDRRKE